MICCRASLARTRAVVACMADMAPRAKTRQELLLPQASHARLAALASDASSRCSCWTRPYAADPMLQDLLREPEAQQLGAAAAPPGRRWYFERLELQTLRCNLTVIPRAPGAREQARAHGCGSTQRARQFSREGTCCLAARLCCALAVERAPLHIKRFEEHRPIKPAPSLQHVPRGSARTLV